MLANSQERLLRLALHCYPEHWRARHGDEAAELATLLARDGVPLRSMTWSYFKGAARERLFEAQGPPLAGRRSSRGGGCADCHVPCSSRCHCRRRGQRA